MTSYLDTNKILWSQTFLQILIKKVLKVLEICSCQQKICQIGTLFIIFLKSHYNSFQKRGQPCFYHQWFNFYNVWHESPDFRRFLLTSYTKRLTSAVGNSVNVFLRCKTQILNKTYFFNCKSNL